jgi:hypothetical protein
LGVVILGAVNFGAVSFGAANLGAVIFFLAILGLILNCSGSATGAAINFGALQ